jgi:protein-tyrosine phosphatase
MEALSKINFRDVGGIAGHEGRLIRKGRMFRSETPASYLPEHVAELDRIGFKLVCDLRSADERAHEPHHWIGGDCRILVVEMLTDMRAKGEGGFAQASAEDSTDDIHAKIVGNYEAMPSALLPHLGDVIDALIAGEMPSLFQCSAGKDRTGVIVATLLRTLGAAQVDIMQDYLRSDIYARNRPINAKLEAAFTRYFGFVPTPEVMRLHMGIDPRFLEAAFAVLDRDWGGFRGYLAAAGVSDGHVAALRETLLMPAS